MFEKTNPVKIVFLTAVLAASILSVVAQPIAAQAPEGTISDDEVNAIAKDLYCPVCESTPLDVCPTQACADWREVIRTKLSQGETADEIRDYFELQYGPRALAEPPREGFSLAVWILPVAALIFGGIVFLRYLRQFRSAPEQPASFNDDIEMSTADPPAKPKLDDYEARIEQELREKYS